MTGLKSHIHHRDGSGRPWTTDEDDRLVQIVGGLGPGRWD